MGHARAGIPGKDGKIGRPRFITNVRNTESKHWTSWLAGTKSRSARTIMSAAAASCRRRPSRSTPRPRRVILTTAVDMKRWLFGTAADVLKLQKPCLAKSLVIIEKKKAA